MHWICPWFSFFFFFFFFFTHPKFHVKWFFLLLFLQARYESLKGFIIFYICPLSVVGWYAVLDHQYGLMLFDSLFFFLPLLLQPCNRNVWDPDLFLAIMAGATPSSED